MVKARPPRGIRNHNPGNIRAVAHARFEGETGADADGYRIFDTPVNGIRAIARQLILYRGRGLRSIAAIIQAWAPPKENNTRVYIKAVADAVRVDARAQIDVRRHAVARPLVEAIIRQENGVQPYSEAVIDAGLWRAGIGRPGEPGEKRA